MPVSMIIEEEPIKRIAFDTLKYGSFTKQFKAYNRTHKHKVKSLEDFAEYVRSHPDDFNARTMKRANFYTNVILKKGETGGLVKTEELLSTDIKRMPNAWITYVKEFASKKGLKYNEALKHPELKTGYTKKGGSMITDVVKRATEPLLSNTVVPMVGAGSTFEGMSSALESGVSRRARQAREKKAKEGTGSNTNGGVMVVPMSATPCVKIAGTGMRRKRGKGVIDQSLDSGYLGEVYEGCELSQHAGRNWISL